MKINLMVILTIGFLSFTAQAELPDCNGYTVVQKHLLELIETLEPGIESPFSTVYLMGNRPPLTYETPVEVIDENSEEFEIVKNLLSKSLEYSPKAIELAKVNPDRMNTYRRSCLFDESSDSEILNRGVEVMQIQVWLSDGTKYLTPYATSYRPAQVLGEDISPIWQHLSQYQKNLPGTVSIEKMIIYHNHVLADSLSEMDLELAYSVFFATNIPTQIFAIVENENKTALVKSQVYNKRPGE